MATLNITTDPAQDARVVKAFGDILGLGRNATLPEIKQAIIAWVRGQVQDYERRDNMTTFAPADLSGS